MKPHFILVVEVRAWLRLSVGLSGNRLQVRGRRNTGQFIINSQLSAGPTSNTQTETFLPNLVLT